MNLLPLLAMSALLHTWIGLRLVPDLAAFPVGQALVASGLGLSALLMPLGLVAGRVARPPLANVLTWLGLLLMGLFSSLLVLTVLRDAALLLRWLAGLVLPLAPLQGFRAASAEWVPLLALLVTLLGFLNARRTAAVVRVDVPIRDLPAALHGFTVAQISDVHVGPTIRLAYLQRIVRRVNALGADVVAITGDLVDGKVGELARHVAPLAELQSRHGTFFVTGNHEYYSGAQAWIVELRRLGLTVLMNEHVVLRHGVAVANAELLLAGVTDFNAHHFDESHRSDPAAALLGAPQHAVRVLLAHQPRSAAAAAQAGFDLQLSGHTHGGQFWPWNLFVRFQQPFTSGLRRLQDLWVYTSRGTGYWGPPKRFGAPSEITCLRLVLAASPSAQEPVSR
ncbi:MAG: serine/threonine protein phosphatase [Polaromonas sp. 39-63-203]|jgi:predicted MPP superfamily phosphohydrolase|uniref:metallophosphoesterase n=1 Tax=Polaromonas sp. TaxID=1869339 RepID=UPI000BD0695E|nr:metallophosphoesterase [Polaromonas sp.]OYY51769.1 MAG: serine/threonine protein phosphatase [Polaromonas sp. 35-63-240]OYZ82123.1 MAG: serine/threonine protein phosphatase [Polaromonas sp. 24-62-144]OZA95948.1 MAG: serine/threonine protein phosphatase [Polaromonas sp. 39-63-203]HQS30389.1 metallophosphoesterase [Polaromonas sp.]HQS90351.1 metallophosphoesterase [Polaromonas sp.]